MDRDPPDHFARRPHERQAPLIVIADRSPLFTEILRALLAREWHVPVAGTAYNLTDLFALLRSFHPDVAVLDCDLCLPNVPEHIDDVNALLPSRRLLLVTGCRTCRLVGRNPVAGLTFVSKLAADDELRMALAAVIPDDFSPRSGDSGQRANDATPADPGPDEVGTRPITSKERQVLLHTANGLTVKEIAVKMNRSPKTVGVHRFNAMRKLELHNSADVTRYVLLNGWVAGTH